MISFLLLKLPLLYLDPFLPALLLLVLEFRLVGIEYSLDSILDPACLDNVVLLQHVVPPLHFRSLLENTDHIVQPLPHFVRRQHWFATLEVAVFNVLALIQLIHSPQEETITYFVHVEKDLVVATVFFEHVDCWVQKMNICPMYDNYCRILNFALTFDDVFQIEVEKAMGAACPLHNSQAELSSIVDIEPSVEVGFAVAELQAVLVRDVAFNGVVVRFLFLLGFLVLLFIPFYLADDDWVG